MINALRRRACRGLVFVPACWLAASVHAQSAGWYGERHWEFRQKITVKGGMVEGGDLTDFPVLVSITNDDAHVFAMARDDGRDILFTAADGATKLAHELQAYTNVSPRHCIAWVKVPLMTAATDTTLYMYYANPDAPDQQAVGEVWSEDFAAVWHLTELLAQDSTSNAVHCTTVGAGSTAYLTNGVIGGAIQFNKDNGIRTGNVQAKLAIAPYEDFTLSFWINTTVNSASGANRIVGFTTTTAAPGLYVNTATTSCRPQAIFKTIIPGATNLFPTVQMGSGDSIGGKGWYYITVVARRDANMTLFYNENTTGWGVDISTAADHAMSTTQEFNIGGRADYPFEGVLDEVRFCRVARSATWRTACYRNQGNPSAYLEFAPAQRYMPPGTIIMVR